MAVSQDLPRPVWVDLITGRVFEVPEGKIERRDGGMTLVDIPMWDSPVLIANRTAVPLAID
ncbi:MAG: hypothetical protein ACOX9C_08250 [Kiritimatiellia bacterium]